MKKVLLFGMVAILAGAIALSGCSKSEEDGGTGAGKTAEQAKGDSAGSQAPEKPQ